MALAWLAALALLLTGSLALAVYAGWAAWRELAAERARPAATASAAAGDATGTGVAAPARPAQAGRATPNAAPRSSSGGARGVERPAPGAMPAASALPPAEAGPAAAVPAPPRPEPRRIPREEAARRLEALGAKLDQDHFQFAIARGEIDQVRVFLEAGYSPNLQRSSTDHSMFFLSLIGLHDPKQEAIATLMLDYGADREVRAPTGITPLMMAAIHCKPGFAAALLDRGAQMNATDPEGTTALVWAQRASCAPVAALLEKRGAR